MKKLILLLSIFAAPLLASADDTAWEVVVPEQGNLPAQILTYSPDSVETQRTAFFDFGFTYLGQRKIANFVLGNNGPFPIRIHGMNVHGRFFGGSTNCPYTLFPGQRCVVRTAYRPLSEGRHHGRLTVWIANDVLTVHLSGRGIR